MFFKIVVLVFRATLPKGTKMKAAFKNLIWAIRNDDRNAVYQLLDQDPTLVGDRLLWDGDTALHLAVRRIPNDGKKILPVVEELKSHGADMDRSNQQGDTPASLLRQICLQPAL